MTPQPDVSPPSLPSALVAHARRHPDRPFLFWPEGADWQWASFAEVAGAVERLSRDLLVRLSAAGVGTGATVAYPDRPLPGRVVLDLALQAAGLFARPVPGAEPAAKGEGGIDAWVEVGGAATGATAEGRPEAAPGGGGEGRRGAELAAPRISLAVDEPWQVAGWRRHGLVGRFDRGPDAREPGAREPEVPQPDAGGVVTTASGTGERAGPFATIDRLTSRQIVVAAEATAATLAGPPGRRGGRPRRDVVVVGRPLADPGERCLLSWATLCGAAVILEPIAGGLVATASWARPTVFRGDAAEIAVLESAAREAEGTGLAGGWLRLRRRLAADDVQPPRPFRRLHSLLVVGAPPAGADLGFWRRRRVRVLLEGEASIACGGLGGE